MEQPFNLTWDMHYANGAPTRHTLQGELTYSDRDRSVLFAAEYRRGSYRTGYTGAPGHEVHHPRITLTQRFELARTAALDVSKLEAGFQPQAQRAFAFAWRKLYFSVGVRRGLAVWSWNGYSLQWVESGLSRDSLNERLLELRQHGNFDSATTLEDGDHLSIVVVNSHDFYGQRVETTVLTTREGSIVMDDDLDNGGDWKPAVIEEA